MTRGAAPRCLFAAAIMWMAALASAAPARHTLPDDPLAPAHAALRSLQFAKAVQLLGDLHNNAAAQYLLGLIYLNGVGVAPDAARARALLTAAAEQGHGAAAYVLAGEAARDANTEPGAVQILLQRSAQLGYPRAIEATKAGHELWAREAAGAADPALLTAWVIDCARNDDVRELRRLGIKSVQVRDEFGRGALQHAAEAGRLAAAAALLDLGADIGASDHQGTTALMIAAQYAPVQMTSLLMTRGANLNAVDAEHRTAAFYAARSNRADTLRVLAASGTAEARDNRGYNALDAALTVQANEAAVELRAQGLRADVTGPSPGRQTGKIDPAHPGEIYRGWPRLALALARNDSAQIKSMLDAGEDVNAHTPQGESMLQVAANAHAMSSVPLLLAHGANPESGDQSGHTVLWLAAVRADLPLVQALLSAGVRPDTHGKAEESPLLAATRGIHSAVAVALLEAGADVGATDVRQRTALMIAGASGQRALLETLLARHSNVDAKDGSGRTALWHAAAAGSAEEVALLLAAGAKISDLDATGLGPLHAAAAQPNARVVESLINAHSLLNSRGGGGDSALMIAAANGRAEVVRALLAHGSALDLQNSSGDTALIAASRGGHAEVCRLLLEAGANRGLRNHAGIAAADVAAGRGFAALAIDISGRS
jgi:ankyrin repeat protein